jgi:hypothetical protein
MLQPALLIEAVAALEAAQVGYCVTGALVFSLQGQRSTAGEVDVIIEVQEDIVEILAGAFKRPRYSFDKGAARRALAQHGGFALLDTETGEKVDFWPLAESGFDQSRFARRVETEVFGRPVAVTSPEDTVLPKLVWASSGFADDLRLEDAIGVYEAQVATIDEVYLDAWAARLGVSDLLAEVRSQAFRN